MGQEKGQKKKRLVLMLKSKGGVGASFVARYLGEVYRRDGVRALLVDGDASVGELVRFLGAKDAAGKLLDPQPRDGVPFFAFHGEERDRDELLSMLGDAAEDVVLVDLPAAALYALNRTKEDTPFLSLVDGLGYAVTVVSMLTPYRSSLRDVADALEYAPNADHVIVRNLAFGDTDDFTKWDASKTKSRATEMGAVVIDLPALRSRIAADIDDANARFLDAHTLEVLSIADRGRMQAWVEKTAKVFGPALALLGIGDGTESKPGKPSAVGSANGTPNGSTTGTTAGTNGGASLSATVGMAPAAGCGI